MKKIIAAGLAALTFVTLFCSCGTESTTLDAPDKDIKVIDLETTRPQQTTAAVKKNKTVKITLPEEVFSTKAGGNIEGYAKTRGYEIVKRENGNITLKMDGITYSLLLSSAGMDAMVFLGELVDEDYCPYAVRLADYNPDFSYILMLVDTKKYNESPDYDTLSAMIGQCGMFYQHFTQNEEKKCEVIIAGYKTGKILHRQTYTQ